MEQETRKKLVRSIVAKFRIPKGTKITSDMLIMKSPGTGLTGHYLSQLIGKTSKSDLEEDHKLSLEDVE